MRTKSLLWNVVSALLGVIFIFYGLLKLLGGQFIFSHDWIIDGSTTDGPNLVWHFFGFSPIYGRLVGLAELVPGFLLLAPRTRLLGALLLVPVAANITVMDFCYGFPPVKYFALLLTLGCVVILAPERARLRRILFLVLEPAPRGDSASEPGTARPRWLITGIALLPVCGLFFAQLLAASLSAGPSDAAYAACADHGWQRADLELTRWRTDSWSGINVTGIVEFRARQDNEARAIRVMAWRPNAPLAWHVTHYEEKPDEGPAENQAGQRR
jgi:uncharacterized membrane protein YphA (DoxX/SURF4 family)